MIRRQFIQRGALALAAPPILGPTSALADYHTGEDEEIRRERIEILLRNPSVLVALTQLIIILDASAFALSLSQPWTRHPLNRADTSRIPLLGGLTRQTVGTRLGPMSLIGETFILGTTMLIALNVAIRIPLETLTIVNADNEYTTDRRLTEVSIEDLEQQLLEAERQNPVGEAFLDEETGELLTLVPPHREVRRAGG